MSDEVSPVARAVAERYRRLLDEGHRAWLSVGITPTVVDNAGVLLTDAADPDLAYASLTGGMYFGPSSYLRELLDAADADRSQIRNDLLGAL